MSANAFAVPELDRIGPVLITGHTGFKGTWLSILLQQLGVPVVGYSLKPKADSLYLRLGLRGCITEEFGDVRDTNTLRDFISSTNPMAIVHLAAQPLVLESYRNPEETFEVNVQGTVNILSAARKSKSVKAVVVATTDKVYRNQNIDLVFKETDPLEGSDPYSASKVGTEAAIKSWQTMSNLDGGPRILAVRSGNVIGGGDASQDRIIPDLIRAFFQSDPLLVRNSQSTRPWQHVLDPLGGYVMALKYLLEDRESYVSAFNFGPEGKSLSVKDVVEISRNIWPTRTVVNYGSKSDKVPYESKTLSLNSELASELLGWKPLWSQSEAISKTINWWVATLFTGNDPLSLCHEEVKEFIKSSQLAW